jgi:hypothetical protein
MGRVIPLALLLAVSAPPEAVSATPASVYRVSPAIDAPIIGASLLAIAIPYAFAGTFIHPHCPCDPNAVNALDRHVIGNQNKFLDDASDMTAGIVMAGPLLLDWLDVGMSRTLLEDATVYGETLAVNGALVTVTKNIVQRPLPRTYAGARWHGRRRARRRRASLLHRRGSRCRRRGGGRYPRSDRASPWESG